MKQITSVVLSASLALTGCLTQQDESTQDLPGSKKRGQDLMAAISAGFVAGSVGAGAGGLAGGLWGAVGFGAFGALGAGIFGWYHDGVERPPVPPMPPHMDLTLPEMQKPWWDQPSTSTPPPLPPQVLVPNENTPPNPAWWDPSSSPSCLTPVPDPLGPRGPGGTICPWQPPPEIEPPAWQPPMLQGPTRHPPSSEIAEPSTDGEDG